MHLNPAKRLLGAEFPDVSIPFMDTISYDMGNVLLRELIKFASFVDSAEASNLSMQFMKNGAMLPAVKK